MLQRRSAFLIHVAVSACVLATLFVWVVTFLYPQPLLQLQGGSKIVGLLVLVDVVLGPLMTLIVFKPGKKSLKFDMAVIIVVQLAAFIYGVSALYSQRPVFIVYVYDRFVVVTAADLLGDSPKSVQEFIPWRGNVRLASAKLPWQITISSGPSILDRESELPLASTPGTYDSFPPSLNILKERALPALGNESPSNTSGAATAPLRFPIDGRTGTGTALVSPTDGALRIDLPHGVTGYVAPYQGSVRVS
jgi:hypothetical protein